MSRFYYGRSRDTDRSFPHGRMEGRARLRKEPTVNNVRGDSKTFRNGAFDADKIMNKRAFVIAATGIRLAIPGPVSRDKHNLPRRMLKRASIIFSCKLYATESMPLTCARLFLATRKRLKTISWKYGYCVSGRDYLAKHRTVPGRSIRYRGPESNRQYTSCTMLLKYENVRDLYHRVWYESG